MSIRLDNDTARLIEEEIQTGRAANAQEFLRRAVRHFVIARDLGEEYTLEDIDAKIARGLASLEHGEGVDGEQFLDSLQKELEEAEKVHGQR